jgi:nitrite reductase/ring-hydroxylating ferredoxin subunit
MTSSLPVLLCQCRAVTDPGTRAFEVTLSGVLIEGILVHWHGHWYAYRNACPHTGVNLNWSPAQFFDLQQRYLQCSLHGALFEPASGYCVYGPCAGDCLTPLTLDVRNGAIYIPAKSHAAT